MSNKIYDISISLDTNTINYPGCEKFNRDITKSFKQKDPYTLSKLSMSSHTGTHVDSPLHFIENGNSIDEIPIDNFILNAIVVEIKNKREINAKDIKSLNIKETSALLFKTDNSEKNLINNNTYDSNFVYIAPSAAEICVEKKIKLIGIDYLSIDGDKNHLFESHKIILGNNIIILECIDLQKVPAGEYKLICLPLKIKGGEASPVRAILIST
ncbi:MAG TPA: cyclase family protein [Victivallales bacterium]|nr:cyclase family protein [Victivallales bacterium]